MLTRNRRRLLGADLPQEEPPLPENEVSENIGKNSLRQLPPKKYTVDEDSENIKFDDKYFDAIMKDNADLDDAKDYHPDNLEPEELRKLTQTDKERVEKAQEEIKALSGGLPDKARILLLPLPAITKDQILKKLEIANSDDSSDSSIKARGWISELLRIPFGKYSTLPVSYKSPDAEHLKHINQHYVDILKTRALEKPEDVRQLAVSRYVDSLVDKEMPSVTSDERPKKQRRTKKEKTAYKKRQEYKKLVEDTVQSALKASETGQEAIDKYLQQCREKMDACIYGQRKIKEAGLDFISKRIRNPEGRGKILVLEGLPGVGKTRFGRHIASALGKQFGFISLGGANDACFLDGSQDVWNGATYGAIVRILIQTQTMDPVIMLDELDKVSGTERGVEVINVLNSITDVSQNKEFSDKYFWGIPFDLSKVTFIGTVNDRNRIPPILRDRLDIRVYDHYNFLDKVEIVRRHILPEILQDIGINPYEIIFPDETIKFLISETPPGEGCRQIARNCEAVLEKVNRLIMTSSATQLPVHVNNAMVGKYLPQQASQAFMSYIH